MTTRRKAQATVSYLLIGGFLMLTGDWLCLYSLAAGRILFGLGGAIVLLPVVYFLSNRRRRRVTVVLNRDGIALRTPSVKKSVIRYNQERAQETRRRETAQGFQVLEEEMEARHRARGGRKGTDKPV